MRKFSLLKLLCLLLFFASVILAEIKYLDVLLSASEASHSYEGMDEFSYTITLAEQILEDIKCFPVQKEENGKYPVSYTDSFGAERTYGGNRTHEGCDLMAVSNERGKYSICSITDGTVTQIGWLEQGGWRIGILSENGIYYYYAHLDSYEKAFTIGEKISAGQILGRMGDSGYGKEPGTKGKFAVHLHVGIYVKDSKGKEQAINPYWYLKHLEF